MTDLRDPAPTNGGTAASIFPERGDLGALCRAMDWSQTPLGPVEIWPQSLKTVAGTALACQFPMVVLWGEELIQIYNDAYREIMGAEHPAGLGQPTRECWPEVWHINEPIYRRVFAGESVTLRDALFPITRHGVLEDSYFTLCYSPVPDESGGVGGVLVTVLETTAQVRAREIERERARAQEALGESEERLRIALDAADLGVWDLDLTTDTAAVRSLRHDQIFGYEEPQPEWGREIARRHVLPEDQPIFEEAFARAAATGVLSCEVRVRWPDGSLHWIAPLGRTHYDREGRPVRMTGVVADITERKEAEAALRDLNETLERRVEERTRQVRESEERYVLATRATGNAVWEWDLSTDRITWAEGIYEVFGYDPDAVHPTAEWWYEAIHPDDRARVISSVHRVIDGAEDGHAWRDEYRLRRGDGSYAVASDRGYVIRDPRGRAVRMVGAMADVTEARRAEAERNRLLREVEAEREAAERANQVKGQFLAVMSHELRTPLTGVIGFADLLETEVLGPMAAAQHEALSRIKASSWHLASIIDEILNLSRVEAGKEEVRWEQTDVAEITRGVVDMVEPQADAAGLRLCLGQAQTPLVTWTDPGKVRQILINLVGNAVKYTREGEVRVEIDHSANEWIEIQVRDTGPGIRPEDQERVFEAFTQVDSSHTRSGSGTGLGLAICRKLARLLGGEIALQSTPGEGSTFTLRLPWRESEGT